MYRQCGYFSKSSIKKSEVKLKAVFPIKIGGGIIYIR